MKIFILLLPIFLFSAEKNEEEVLLGTVKVLAVDLMGQAKHYGDVIQGLNKSFVIERGVRLNPGCVIVEQAGKKHEFHTLPASILFTKGGLDLNSVLDPEELKKEMDSVSCSRSYFAHGRFSVDFDVRLSLMCEQRALTRDASFKQARHLFAGHLCYEDTNDVEQYVAQFKPEDFLVKEEDLPLTYVTAAALRAGFRKHCLSIVKEQMTQHTKNFKDYIGVDDTKYGSLQNNIILGEARYDQQELGQCADRKLLLLCS